jgi:cytochrome c oxidase cbb3-type subunit I/II
MPAYTWLFDDNTDYASLSAKIRVQRTLGVPFPNWSPADIDRLAHDQAKEIAKELRDQGRYTDPDKEIVALTAYLQCLGKKWDATGAPATAATP